MRPMLSPASLSSLTLCLGLLCACERNTEYRKYHSNGVLEMKVSLHNGQRTGVMEEFYPTGARRATVEWKNDRQHGVATHYYESGQLKEVSHWRDDSLAGISQEFYPNGKLKLVSHYEHDVPVGERLVFDDRGALVEKQLYNDHGLLIYVADYDNRGRQQQGLILPLFADKADTITLGQSFETVVQFGFKLSGDVRLLVGTINQKTGEVLDTSQVLSPDSNGRFTIQVRPPKAGEARVSYKFQHRPKNRLDTLSVDGLFGSDSYYVRPE